MKQAAMQGSGDKPQPFLMEHRWGQRWPCRANVRLVAGPGIGGAGRVRDVSASGAFIETSLELPVYARVGLLVLGNESATHAAEIAASVVRVARDGIGVEWCETPAGSICARLGCATRCAILAIPRE
jgi:hypothetical protein